MTDKFGQLPGVMDLDEGEFRQRFVDMGDGTWAPVVFAGNGGSVPATDGAIVYPDAWPSTWAYNGDGSVNYQEITSPDAIVYRQTFGYTTGQVTSRTGWVAQ